MINTPKNYFRFSDDIDKLVNNKLQDISIGKIDASHIRVNYDEDVIIPGYRLAFLNCIHFPDPLESAVSRDLDVIERSKLLTKKIKI